MILSRRTLISGAAAGVIAPDVSWAAQALASASNWSLATADVEADLAPRPLRLASPARSTATARPSSAGRGARRPIGSTATA
jgi:hypothetical protein